MDDAIEPGESTTGPILVGSLLQVFCQGVVFAQVYTYWDTRTDDTLRMKSFVAILLLLSVLQTAIEVYKVWLVVILHRLWSTSPLKWTDILLNGIIVILCETFLIRRCWKATNKKFWVFIPLALVALSIFIANIFLAMEVGETAGNMAVDDPLRSKVRYLPSAMFAFSYWIFGSLALDTTMTAILSVFLWRSKTGLNYLDKVLRHIIGITWESAAVPFISMLIAVCIYHARHDVNYQLILIFVLSTGKFYMLGLLRTLNSRVKLRERMTSTDMGRRSLSDWQWDQEQTAVERPSISEITPTYNPVRARASISAIDIPRVLGSDDSIITRVGDNVQEVRSIPPMPVNKRTLSP